MCLTQDCKNYLVGQSWQMHTTYICRAAFTTGIGSARQVFIWTNCLHPSLGNVSDIFFYCFYIRECLHNWSGSGLSHMHNNQQGVWDVDLLVQRKVSLARKRRPQWGQAPLGGCEAGEKVWPFTGLFSRSLPSRSFSPLFSLSLPCERGEALSIVSSDGDGGRILSTPRQWSSIDTCRILHLNCQNCLLIACRLCVLFVGNICIVCSMLPFWPGLSWQIVFIPIRLLPR